MQAQATLVEILESLLRRVPGCDAVAVVGMDGMMIEQRAHSASPDLEIVAAQHTSLLKEAAAARREAETGDPSELILLTDRHQFLSRQLGGEYFLLLVLRPNASLGQARFEARRAGPQIEEDLR